MISNPGSWYSECALDFDWFYWIVSRNLTNQLSKKQIFWNGVTNLGQPFHVCIIVLQYLSFFHLPSHIKFSFVLKNNMTSGLAIINIPWKWKFLPMNILLIFSTNYEVYLIMGMSISDISLMFQYVACKINTIPYRMKKHKYLFRKEKFKNLEKDQN